MTTTEKTLSTEELASIAAEALKGKSIRATALKPGDAYISATWTQPKTYREVTFIGFGRDKANLAAGIPQLKTLTALDKFYFTSNGEDLVADGRVAGNVFIGENAGHRMTFFERLVSTAAAIEAPVTEAEPEHVGEVVIEAPIESDPHVEAVIQDMIGEDLLPAEVVAEAHTEEHIETFGEKMARLRAEKKARAAAEAAAAIEAQIAEASNA